MREKLPPVSVIMIVKNGERFIRDALKSVYNQNYSTFEVIVVDGSSADNTLSIVNEFEPDRIIHQEGEGISDAYNTGIKAAKTEFVSFLSADDLWATDKLRTQMKFMVNHPEIMFTNSLIEYFTEPGSTIPNGFRKNLLDGPKPARIMENFVARKEVFEEVGFFNTDLSTAEDVDWFSRAQDRNILNRVLNKVLLKKRIHDRNTSMNVKKNNINLMKVLRNTVRRKSHQL